MPARYQLSFEEGESWRAYPEKQTDQKKAVGHTKSKWGMATPWCRWSLLFDVWQCESVGKFTTPKPTHASSSYSNSTTVVRDIERTVKWIQSPESKHELPKQQATRSSLPATNESINIYVGDTYQSVNQPSWCRKPTDNLDTARIALQQICSRYWGRTPCREFMTLIQIWSWIFLPS